MFHSENVLCSVPAGSSGADAVRQMAQQDERSLRGATVLAAAAAACLLAAGAAAASLGMAGAALAQTPGGAPAAAGAGGTPEGVLKWLFDTFNLVFASGAAFGAAAGVLGKWLFDQWSERLKAQRTFAAKVADSVVKLSQEHYWRLATVSGVLARGLQEAVQNRMLHLALPWDTRGALKARLGDLSSKAAKETFPHLVVLISCFEKFQFRGSNTYLLTRHSAGEDCKRLYNAFIDSLSEELQERLAELHAREIDFSEGAGPPKEDDAPKKEGEAAKKAETPSNKKRASEVAPADLRPDIVEREFPEESAMWRRWLHEQPAMALRGADMLRAYSELLSQELAELHKDWLVDGRPWSGIAAGGSRWNIVSDRSRAALDHVFGSSTLYLPLGAGLTDRRGDVQRAKAPASAMPAAEGEEAGPRQSTSNPTATPVNLPAQPAQPAKYEG